jgi:hypothetical protein
MAWPPGALDRAPNQALLGSLGPSCGGKPSALRRKPARSAAGAALGSPPEVRPERLALVAPDLAGIAPRDRSFDVGDVSIVPAETVSVTFRYLPLRRTVIG